MKVRFRTGEMAKMYGVSKQTIIYYDKIGLYKPNFADPDTGYRYYTLAQCEVLDVILALKHLGMPLKEIKRYLATETLEGRMALLEEQEEQIADRLAVIERSRRRINSMIASFKSRMQLTPFEMGVRYIARRKMYSVPVQPPYDHYQLELAVKATYQDTIEAFDSGLHELLAITEDGPNGEKLFRKIGVYVEKDGNDAAEAGDYAYIIHKGPYESIPESKEKLLAYVRKMNLVMTGPYIENVLMDSMAVSTESDYLVEVLVPVTPVASL